MKKSVGKISVVIPVLNGSRTLRKTLQTVREQNDFDSEIVVVDDGSSEDLSEMAKEMGAIFHRLPTTQGPATARTEGAKIATGEIILFTDSDVWLPDRALEKIRKAFSEHECECIQGTFSQHCPHTNFFSQYKNLYNRYVLGLLGPWINTTYTSITAVKKDFFFSSSGFDCNIRGASVEDRSLGENLVRAGGGIFIDHSIEVVHNKHLSLRGFYRSQFYRSRDLAKLLLRQKESEFFRQGDTFGTNTRQAMLRLPLAWGFLLLSLLSFWTPWLEVPGLVLGVLYLWMSKDWILNLAKEKGWGFALKAQAVEFTDALTSAVGVALGLFEYKILRKKY